MNNDFENDMGEVFNNFRVETEKKDLIFEHIVEKAKEARLKTNHKRKRFFLLFICFAISVVSAAILGTVLRLQPYQSTPSGMAFENYKFQSTHQHSDILNHNSFNHHQVKGSEIIGINQNNNINHEQVSYSIHADKKTNLRFSHGYLKKIIKDKRIAKSNMYSVYVLNNIEPKQKGYLKNRNSNNQSTRVNNNQGITNQLSIHQTNQTEQTTHTIRNNEEKLTSTLVTSENTNETSSPIELTKILPVNIQSTNQPVSQSLKSIDSFVGQEPMLFPNVLRVSGANRHRFSIGARLMPMVSFNHYGFQDTSAILPFSTLAGNSLLLSQRIKDDVPSFSYTVGIFGTYQPITFLRLELGVNYSSYTTPFSFRDTSTSPTWPFLNENEVYDYEYDLKFGQFTTTANYIGIPITLVGILPLGRVELGLRVSGTPSFIIMADTYTYEFNYTYLRHTEYSTSDTIFNRFNFNLAGGIHIAYTWKDKLRFSLTPEISYNITSLYQNHYAISQNTWGIGGNLGIEYLFNRGKKK